MEREPVSQATRSQYGERGYGRSVGWGERPAVLVVDFQTGLTDHQRFSLASDYDREVLATRELVDGGRASGCPIVFAVLAFEADGSDGGIMALKIPPVLDFVVGSEATRVDPRLGAAAEDLVVRKSVQSAFFGTGLHDRLQALDVDSLLVAGCTTSGCVRATVTEAASYGYKTSLVTDCVGDQAGEPHRANLFDMAEKNADLVSLDEVLSHLSSVRVER